ncbi:MAG: helix-turn-helix transcriptional regulator [Pseudobutyrivibrio sp.]|nr:helix-turn-helix transcriptional regulator [Pseudobutyrivibrio sp.]
MAIGERIHFFRTKRGMTQKYVGGQIGFDDKSADVRMAQYESETRVPKDNLVDVMASVFDVEAAALKVPDIDTYVGLFHTLFALEDRYGLKAEIDTDGQPRLYIDMRHHPDGAKVYDMALEWGQMCEALLSKEITQDEYDNWKYHYPHSSKNNL